MGAVFKSMKMDGKLIRKQVEAEFLYAQEKDRHENGHQYSGGFGMADGILFASRTFAGEATANTWLEDNCQKFGPAIAVTYLDEHGAAAWLVGANCAS